MDADKKNNTSGSVITSDMTITGDVLFKGSLRVDGQIDGSIQGEQLFLGSNGMLDSDINVDTFNCQGSLQGNVTATHIVVEKTARIMGTIEAKDLDMAPEAVFTGVMKIGSIPDPERKNESPARSKKTETASINTKISLESSVFEGLIAALSGGSSLIMIISDDKHERNSLCDTLRDHFVPNSPTVILDKPTGSFKEIMMSIASGYGIELTDCLEQEAMVKDLSLAMDDPARFLLIVNNVETMYPATLERMLRYFAGDENGNKPLVRLVLCGGYELKKMMLPGQSRFFVRDPDCTLEL
ncbi:MAG: hypothetical protein CSA26_06185 [Desulfobacterales bacterium]|nr:MAG: hypothetical protein CSA26_06185 [Desulfobacterales bacterium]